MQPHKIISRADWVIIGRFGKPHGIKGLITIHSFAEPDDNLFQYENLEFFFQNRWQTLQLADTSFTSKS
ncbi:MAG: hypothetical protein Q8R79_00380, partial [Legionellaceae bacterium]|nr:hypothetical protein [Legionellaceae bacterium]